MQTNDNNLKLIHQGFAHSRTTMVQGFRDTAREKALADSWDAENPAPGSFGQQPVLNALVPDCTQRDAQVAATVVQWLGSDVGFYFLQEALGKAGYEIAEHNQRAA